MADVKRLVRVTSASAPLVMSAAAVLLLILALKTGWGAGPPGDEGAAAHLWQLLVGLQLPLIAAFAATADWRRPSGALGILGLQLLGLMLAAAPVAILRL